MANGRVLDAPTRPSASIKFDRSVFGRAQAAFDAEFAKWQAQIDAVQTDPSLSPDQRGAALLALRAKQAIEANGARDRIANEEKQRFRFAKKMARELIKKL